MNLIYMLDELVGAQLDICNTLKPIMTILGYVIFAIQVAVPVILVIVGMIALAKAIMSQDEKEIKTAQSGLIKKIVVAVIIYLVITIISLLMKLIAPNLGWKECTKCAFSPFDDACGIVTENVVE